MRIFLMGLCLLLSVFTAPAQRLLSWSPEFPTETNAVSFTIDCTKGNQGLLNFEGGNSPNVYVHVGVITNLSTGPSDWKYTKFTWGTADPAAKATPLGNNKYQYTISNPRTFFNVPAGETIKKISIIFRNAAGNNSTKQVNSDNSDMYLPVYGSAEFAVRINMPPFEPRYVPWIEPINANIGNTITVSGVSSSTATLTMRYNVNAFTATVSNTTSINTAVLITSACLQTIMLEANNGTSIVKDSFSFFVAPTVTTQPLPAGLQDGINYAANGTEATLVLYAPGKTSATVIGDFNNWTNNCNYQMTKTTDNNRFFIKLTGLTPGTIYKYQYLVDGTIKIADPYSELVLDPNNDPFINAATYPNLPAYPTGSTTGIVGTLQTNAPGYTWTTSNYVRPDKKNLLIYELLLRDFLANGNWQTLTDTLDYIKKMGINAIEVMPFNEFEGNLSWGYNPDFYFAPDKAYGTKNNLKKFIDEAHKRGIAVIMDAVFNHATGLSPLAQLYWDAANNRPAANSPYFNPLAKHPFNVFNDFNHDSEATKYHLARYVRHWLTEYKLDGFRWDLSKGFTQKQCADVNCWNQYDATRIATWQRYYDSAQAISPGSYYILEHLGNDDEEAELAHRGMLLWGKMTDQYNQNTMGYVNNSAIDRSFYKNRAGWADPLLVTYAESHDEERIMYKNLAFGNSNGGYNVKSLATALQRTEAMQPFLLLIPGPKMIWQFGEVGYDHSIFECGNGTVPQPYGSDQCKTDPKQILWNYKTEPARKRIYDVISALNKLRALKPSAFLVSSIGGNLGNDLKKSLVIDHADLKLVVVGNFDVSAQNIVVNFPSTGIWYNYISGGTMNASTSLQTISLQPGEYKIFINEFISSGLETVVPPVIPTIAIPQKNGLGLLLYPNPVNSLSKLDYIIPQDGNVTISLFSSTGQKITELLNSNKLKGSYSFPLGRIATKMSAGVYFVNIRQQSLSFTGTIVKK
ncbi:MAG: type sorting protein [Ferruginibacter sp.]|nr:type sorting protein [Ferruginibacter sp.]